MAKRIETRSEEMEMVSETPCEAQCEVLRFGPDTTWKWECDGPEFVLWLRWKGIFASNPMLHAVDLWKFEQGDRLRITNRMDDLPAGFELHPTEAQNHCAYRMTEKLRAGYKPAEPVLASTLWRLMAGDRILRARVGPALPAPQRKPLTIVIFEENALVSADIAGADLYSTVIGRDPGENHPPEVVRLVHSGIEAARKMGLPRTMADLVAKWGICW